MSDNKTVFVGNLNYKTQPAQMGPAFEKFGKVAKARVITRRFRGQIISRGFGFVEFENAADAAKAIAECEKTKLVIDEREVKVVASKPPVKKPRLTAFLGGVLDSTTEEQIRAIFPTAKEVSIHPPNNNRRGFAFVKFETEDALMAAIKNLRETKIGEATVVIRIAHPQFRRPSTRRYRRAPAKTNPVSE
ncbi:RNA-binding protein, putative [Trichomonas vaginalis G3]|uniref:RNA-binding protein, putative n=1 Tax=Trichomonas vaginalis (strain ATCC PRA-98 / G3) TaxID=412133 RepID=A2E6S8_TRIV3|nr:RNA-binding protein family [Trichomonas vaginalis G3]EAY11672.1 RNA-binding protein, putative [Trichomonas vaginalis G3]KAI5494923.1 RNA-binding protein family [Trichomonas vaginalis G3]|eukprot:XP_001323895.1 RNA-binding protein [Trichomonas vaginalis G3]